MDSPEVPTMFLVDLVQQLARIADSLETLNKRFEKEAINVRAVIEECPVIKIRST